MLPEHKRHLQSAPVYDMFMILFVRETYAKFNSLLYMFEMKHVWPTVARWLFIVDDI